jgi:DNA replication and repair protein RecF
MRGLIQLEPDLTRFYRRISTAQEEVGVVYRGQVVSELDDAGLLSAEVMAEEMTTELAEYRDRERHAGHTLCGPHRDALTFTLDGVGADSYGSQGQLKGILVAWKMAEVRFLEGCSGQRPVLLLDDVFSELDEVRSTELVALVEDFDQVLLTAPRLPGEGLCGRFSQLRMA